MNHLDKVLLSYNDCSLGECFFQGPALLGVCWLAQSLLAQSNGLLLDSICPGWPDVPRNTGLQAVVRCDSTRTASPLMHIVSLNHRYIPPVPTPVNLPDSVPSHWFNPSGSTFLEPGICEMSPDPAVNREGKKARAASNPFLPNPEFSNLGTCQPFDIEGWKVLWGSRLSWALGDV